MPVLSLACHLPHNTPNIPSRYNIEQTTKQTKAINNSYIYISHVNVTQTVPDISPLMPMHQDPLLVVIYDTILNLGPVSTLTHWDLVTHICLGKQTIIGSENGLSPWGRQTIIWTNAGILLTGPLGLKFSENLIRIQTFSFKKMHLKMSSAKRRPFCLGLNMLRCSFTSMGDLIVEIRHLSYRDFLCREGSRHFMLKWATIVLI